MTPSPVARAHPAAPPRPGAKERPRLRGWRPKEALRRHLLVPGDSAAGQAWNLRNWAPLTARRELLPGPSPALPRHQKEGHADACCAPGQPAPRPCAGSPAQCSVGGPSEWSPGAGGSPQPPSCRGGDALAPAVRVPPEQRWPRRPRGFCGLRGTMRGLLLPGHSLRPSTREGRATEHSLCSTCD